MLMSYAKMFALLVSGLMLVSAAVAEEVIWRNPRVGTSDAIIPDQISMGAGPAGAGSADYLLAQVLVQCNPGQPRVGLPGSVNKIRTFFRNDAQINFEFLPGATLNADTGQFEIQGFARLNVFEAPSPAMLPSFNQNPNSGVVVKAVFSQDLNTDTIEVRAMDLLNLPNPVVIQENTTYYIGLTPFFLNFSDLPFSGIHFSNEFGLGNENQSAVRQTAPDFGEWMFAGDAFGPPRQQFATIQINGPSLFTPGDVNLDGVVNLLDIQPFVALLGNGQFMKEADINGDGFVNLLDIEQFVFLLGS